MIVVLTGGGVNAKYEGGGDEGEAARMNNAPSDVIRASQKRDGGRVYRGKEKGGREYTSTSTRSKVSIDTIKLLRISLARHRQRLSMCDV